MLAVVSEDGEATASPAAASTGDASQRPSNGCQAAEHDGMTIRKFHWSRYRTSGGRIGPVRGRGGAGRGLGGWRGCRILWNEGSLAQRSVQRTSSRVFLSHCTSCHSADNPRPRVYLNGISDRIKLHLPKIRDETHSKRQARWFTGALFLTRRVLANSVGN